MTGIMQTDVHLLGTSLKLQKGQKVALCEATNLPPVPSGKRYFARPADGKWSDGVERNEEDSILLDEGDYTLTPEA